MIGTPFIIGPDERAVLERLRDLATAAPVDMMKLLAGPGLKDPARKRRHMRQMNEQSVPLPFGYLVTFSIETNHPQGRTARHMSMSSPAKDRVPRPEAVWMVAEILGFTGAPGIEHAEENLKMCQAVWMEDLQGHGEAVNVVQFVMSDTALA